MNYSSSLRPRLPSAKATLQDIDEIRPQYVLDAPDANALFASDIVRSNGASISETISQLENAAITDLNSEWQLALPSYSDQVLPFNVTLAGANEYGAMCASKILGVEILNEGSGISVDDAVTESQATFVARAIEPLQAVISPLHQVSPSRRTQNPSRAGARARPPACTAALAFTPQASGPGSSSCLAQTNAPTLGAPSRRTPAYTVAPGFTLGLLGIWPHAYPRAGVSSCTVLLVVWV